MVFVIAILTATLFVLAFEKPLKKHPTPFYLIAAGLSLVVVIVRCLGITFGGFFGTYVFPLIGNASLGAAFFVLVMYANTFKNGSEAIKLLMPLRGELSILASILTLGHIVAYGITYLPKLFTAPSKLKPVILVAVIFSLIMVVVLLPLFVTSFPKIRRKMKALKWKKLQRFAYAFYALIYLHVILFNVSGALRGSERQVLNLAVYSVVFLWYLVSRLCKAYAMKHKEFDLNRVRYVSLVLILFLSFGLYGMLKNGVSLEEEQTAKKVTEVAMTDAQVQKEEAPAEEVQTEAVTDGCYQATAFGYEGNITIEIVVKDGAVSSVYFTNYEDDEEYKAFSDGLLEEIIKDPLGEVDAVSGATFSTKAVIEAYDKALKQAGINR